jgi:SagB-type dehydrogenase family enzyme
MGRLVSGGPDGLIGALGFAVREVPLPAWLHGTALALVAPEYGRERLEPTGAAVPMLALAAGAERDAVLWRLVAEAARRRGSDADQGSGFGFGAALDQMAAIRASFDDVVIRRTPPDKAVLLVGWERSVSSPVHPEFDAELTCRLRTGTQGTLLVEALLRQNGPPNRSIRAFGCATSLRAAVRAALDGILTRAAVGGWSPGASSVDESLAEEVEFEHVDDVSDAEFAAAVGDAADLLTLYETDSGSVVRCRLPSNAAPSSATSPSSALGPVLDFSAFGSGSIPGSAPGHRPAPIELSLVCEPARVRMSRLFHENSKLRNGFRTLPGVDVDRLGRAAMDALARPYRDYGRLRTNCALPSRDESAEAAPLLPLDQAVRGRRSAAPMGMAPIPLTHLARILDLSAGITATARTTSGARLPLRATPTAGGLCANDVFVLARRVAGLASGLYYFHPGRRLLQLIDGAVDHHEVAEHTGYTSRVEEASAVFVYVGAFRRSQWKYGERGYRNVLIECGHLAQSVVVAAAALGLVAHPLIGFVDDYFNQLIGVNGTDDAVLYLTLLGGRADAV